MSATVCKGIYCIIHKEGLKNDDDHLISPQSYDSWATLLEAAEIQKHEALLQIARNAQEGEVPEYSTIGNVAVHLPSREI